MNTNLLKHVLFKDLLNYIKRTDYFGDYTETEKSWIKKNLGLIGEKEIKLIIDNKFAGAKYLSYKELEKLVNNKEIQLGITYIINDFLSMWLENNSVKYSDKYNLLLTGISNSSFLESAILLEHLDWEIKYDFNKILLKEDVYTKGQIIYLKDKNNNIASFDFKNIKLKKGYLFQTASGKENSNNCSNNDLLNVTNTYLIGNCNNNIINGDNNIITCSGLFGTINNSDTTNFISDDIFLKLIIYLNNQYYIDYLDKETLTHLFYAIDNILQTN